MRKLTFGVADQSYELLYQATLFAEPSKLDSEDHVHIAKIRARFRAIGTPNMKSWDEEKDPRKRAVLWETPKGGVVVLENAEWDLLRSLFKNTKWKPFLSEEVMAASTLLEQAPVEEPVVESKPALVKGG